MDETPVYRPPIYLIVLGILMWVVILTEVYRTASYARELFFPG